MTESAPPAPPKTPLSKVAASSVLSGTSAGLVAWLWNGFVGEPKMPAEVAGVLAGLLGPVIAYLVSWLPRPPAGILVAALLMPATLAACSWEAVGTTQLEAWTNLDADGKVKSCYTKFIDGKERDGGVFAQGTICGQPFYYAAGAERTAAVLRIRQEAEKASLEVAGRIIPDVVNAFIGAYTGAATLGAVSDAAAGKMALEAAKAKAEAMKAGAKPSGTP